MIDPKFIDGLLFRAWDAVHALLWFAVIAAPLAGYWWWFG